MATINLDSPNVHVSRDGEGNIVHIEHIREPVALDAPPIGPPTLENRRRAMASTYVQASGNDSIYNLERWKFQLEPPSPFPPNPFTSSPNPQLHLAGVKSQNGLGILSFVQTLYDIPVWQSGLSVTIVEDTPDGLPLATSSQSTLHFHKDLESDPELQPVITDPFLPNRFTQPTGINVLAQLLGLGGSPGLFKSINQSRLLIYRYDATDRTDPKPPPLDDVLFDGGPPTLPTLLPVTPEIFDGRHRLVSEVLFSMDTSEFFIKSEEPVNWRAFIDVRTGDVLYLRAFVAACFGSMFPTGTVSSAKPDATGMVCCVDPVTKGEADPLAGRDAATVGQVLDGFRKAVNIPLTPVNPGQQQLLVGEFIQINGSLAAPTDSDPSVLKSPNPSAPPPDFTYSMRSGQARDFTAVNAYYHCDSMFRMMMKLGFADPKTQYFLSATGFPMRVDPAGTNGRVDAYAYGDTVGDGVQKLTFGAMQPFTTRLV
ncbi:MAG TPA: hypothetical protein VEX13_18480, partial [Chloroflexia bacterium]|nr:hypothetical protein [Chloroflexia bacterium]